MSAASGSSHVAALEVQLEHVAFRAVATSYPTRHTQRVAFFPAPCRFCGLLQIAINPAAMKLASRSLTA